MRPLAAAALLSLIAVSPVLADVTVVVAKRTVRPGVVVTAADVGLGPIADHRASGAATRLDQVIGQEVRRALSLQRPVRLEDLGPPTAVERNSLVSVAYSRDRVRLTTIGRALDRGGLGEQIRVVNIDSRAVVVGQIMGPGMVEVAGEGR
ncbi:flagellar basal body P-ring formation chaperone FlgA [Marinivivus vitaminiproducens]|uniref:flagellar basal body P-ring formation chaperone FlgA n=1 Tax=Marinivivus vitaminiproducens TaxID=3035935 RepID=UPI0027AAAFFC|nr:flagellar basal body P-ring formation chaperone FlgA [Geminicoccaceae bacterium SCSIO 64248]